MCDKDKARIIEANARLYLEKETEHFLSDLHGEYEAYECARRFVSGAVRRKIDALFEGERGIDGDELAAIIAFPDEKLDEIRSRHTEGEYGELMSVLSERLIRLCAYVAAKHTEASVREAIREHTGVYAELIGELILSVGVERKREYAESIYRGFQRLELGRELAVMLCSLIRTLTAGRLHVVGDIYDRGPRPDLIVDAMMRESAVDLTWGNHDALWLSASLGCPASVATAVANSLFYGNTELLGMGYGISLGALADYAESLYKDIDIEVYFPPSHLRRDFRGDRKSIAKMMKVIALIRAKLEAQMIDRHPEYNMQDSILLGNISGKHIFIKNKAYPLRDTYLPTVSPDSPYMLTDGERGIIEGLCSAFRGSARLQRHAEYLVSIGGAYRISNENLILHGCVPLTKDGELLPLAAGGGLSGRALLDHLDRRVKDGFSPDGDEATRRETAELLWFLWCGKNSPLAARERMTSLERLLVADPETHAEPRNAYYRAWDDPALAEMILCEFGLYGTRSRIINGHIPVKRGESPIKAGGRIIVIDGGFSSAYYPKTGIGGYTLIYNSEGMRLVTHKPFISREDIIKNNGDVIAETALLCKMQSKIRVRETDAGAKIRDWLAEKMGN